MRISRGECTSFKACDTVQTIDDYKVWEKVPATPTPTGTSPTPTPETPSTPTPTDATPTPTPLPPTEEELPGSVSYVLTGDNMRCHSSHRTSSWGDLGRPLTAEQCQEKCNAMAECKFFSMRISKGECTSFMACDTVQTMADYKAWEKVPATPTPADATPTPTPESLATPTPTDATPTPTPVPPTEEEMPGSVSYVLTGDNMRCHSSRRTSNWGDLGRPLTAEQCQEKCNAMA